MESAKEGLLVRKVSYGDFNSHFLVFELPVYLIFFPPTVDTFINLGFHLAQ